MNYLFYNPSARNGKAAEDLQLIKKTLDGQDVEISFSIPRERVMILSMMSILIIRYTGSG